MFFFSSSSLKSIRLNPGVKLSDIVRLLLFVFVCFVFDVFLVGAFLEVGGTERESSQSASETEVWTLIILD